MSDIHTHTLEVPGATLRYDVRGELGDAGPENPALLLVASPMDARGFATLATYFTDRAVVTYDPRGAERSVRPDPTLESTPEEHADDLHRIIEALDVGPVDLFGSSGGAVNGLALVAAHPEQVRTFVAHEPPLPQLLPDREQAHAACTDVYETYQRSGHGPAMAKFMALVSRSGPIPDSYADEPAPDPAAFGLSAMDDGSRDDVLAGQNIRTCTSYQPDLGALRDASTRVVIAAGQESDGQLAARAAAALADLLGTELAVFPSHHGGFMGNEFGMPGEPEKFAVALRAALQAY